MHWEITRLGMLLHTGVFYCRTRVVNKRMLGSGAGAEAVSGALCRELGTRGFSRQLPEFACAGTHRTLAEILQTFSVQISIGGASPTPAVMPAGIATDFGAGGG